MSADGSSKAPRGVCLTALGRSRHRVLDMTSGIVAGRNQPLIAADVTEDDRVCSAWLSFTFLDRLPGLFLKPLPVVGGGFA